ncbi:MAG: hypothetical protein GXY53_02395 [Desulfobulbus sp.]|nr:hypothetical protein [Desulfobulbus sp.]
MLFIVPTAQRCATHWLVIGSSPTAITPPYPAGLIFGMRTALKKTLYVDWFIYLPLTIRP